MSDDVLPYATASEATFTEATKLQKLSWILYDWANSGFGLIIISVVFPNYFIRALLPLLPGQEKLHGLVILGIEVPGSAVMGILTSISMLLMALAAPVLGAIADIKGWTRRMLTVFASAGSLLAMMMFQLQPGDWVLGAVLFVFSNVCFGTSFAFSSAFLPRLTAPRNQGSLSGWGFAVGYVGGALALIVVLLMINANPDATRWGLAFSGLWWLIFSLPAFIFLDETPPQRGENDTGPLLTAGIRRIRHTFRNIRQYRMLFLFLLAFLLYNDGVETVIAMSSSFGTDVLNMTEQELIKMFLIVQFVAFAGAAAFGMLADRLGNKNVIIINLMVWVIVGILAIFVHTVEQFTWLAVLVGLVLGGVQSSSRALMALLAPKHIHNEAFGFFSISGKFASIAGPLVYAGLATGLGPRYGIFSVFPFMVAGFIVLLFVVDPQKPDKASAGVRQS